MLNCIILVVSFTISILLSGFISMIIMSRPGIQKWMIKQVTKTIEKNIEELTIQEEVEDL